MFDYEGEEEFQNILARIAFGARTDQTVRTFAVNRGALVSPLQNQKQIARLTIACRTGSRRQRQESGLQAVRLCLMGSRDENRDRFSRRQSAR